LTTRRWFGILALTLAVVALMLAVGAFLMYRIVNRTDYAERIGDPLIPINEKAFKLTNRRCGVLIFGDSSATSGIDPLVLGQHGLNVCDISATLPIVAAFGTMSVDVFLDRNPRPQILLLQFGPEAFYREKSWDHLSLSTPVTLLLRDTLPSFAISRLVSHVSAVVRVEEIVLKGVLFPPPPAEQARLQAVFRRMIAAYEASGGLLVFEREPETTCSAAVDLLGPVDKAWVKQMRQKYEGLGIRVLVKASPIPSCDPQADLFRRDLNQVVDGAIESLPVGLFLSGNRHLTRGGAAAESQVLARQLEAFKDRGTLLQ
jgi:hypothetical protein